MSEAETIDSLPDAEMAGLARASATELSRLLAGKPDADRARVCLDGTDLVLPRQALALLRDMLTQMAAGNAVTVVPTHAELTTQEAANILSVSRPHLVKLLETGEIAFTRTGSHRRIRYEDLLAYKRQRDERSRQAMDEMARLDQEMGLY